MRAPLLLLSVLFLAGCGEGSSGKPVSAPERAPDPQPAADPKLAALIFDLVEGEDPDERMAAHEALRGYGAAVVEPLAAQLDREDVDAGIGAWIAEVLGSLGPVAEPAAPALYRRLMQGGECSATTSWALRQIGAPGVPYLARALESEHEKTRTWAADALFDVEELAAPAAAALEKALDDPVAEVRMYVIQALGHIDRPLSESAFRRLVALTRDTDEAVRVNSAEVLAEKRGHDPAVQARLREMVLHGPGDDDYLRASILESLDQVLGRDADALAFLRKVAALPDEDHGLRPVAQVMLLERGIDEPELVSAVATIPDGEAFDALLSRASSLSRSGPRGRKAALPILHRVLGWSPDGDERTQAATLLGTLGTAAASDEATLALLKKHADDTNEEDDVRAAARAAIDTLSKTR